jgi:hypothetical protein
MQPTQLFFALVAVCATTVMAVPAPAPVPGALEVRGFICDFLPGPAANDACSTICKQEGNGKGGHCIGERIDVYYRRLVFNKWLIDGTCTCLHWLRDRIDLLHTLNRWESFRFHYAINMAYHIYSIYWLCNIQYPSDNERNVKDTYFKNSQALWIVIVFCFFLFHRSAELLVYSSIRKMNEVRDIVLKLISTYLRVSTRPIIIPETIWLYILKRYNNL